MLAGNGQRRMGARRGLLVLGKNPKNDVKFSKVFLQHKKKENETIRLALYCDCDEMEQRVVLYR
jgi:hypothetical protein